LQLKSDGSLVKGTWRSDKLEGKVDIFEGCSLSDLTLLAENGIHYYEEERLLPALEALRH